MTEYRLKEWYRQDAYGQATYPSVDEAFNQCSNSPYRLTCGFSLIQNRSGREAQAPA